MVEFEGISDRLYRVIRLASKETGKQVKLDITGGSIEMDRGVLDRMTPAFEHLLRNCVAHGIEDPATRSAAGKDSTVRCRLRCTVATSFTDSAIRRVSSCTRVKRSNSSGSKPAAVSLACAMFPWRP